LGNRAQVIITSDTYPKEMAGIDDRLISRFDSGLTVAIEPPELEMRVAILMKKAAATLFPDSGEEQASFLHALLAPGPRGNASVWMVPPRPGEIETLPREAFPEWLPPFIEVVTPGVKIGLSEAYKQGEVYPLDFSSVLTGSAMLSARDSLPREARILDLCAAPGGKSILASALLRPGLILANEVEGRRLGPLRHNLSRCRIAAAHTQRLDTEEIAGGPPFPGMIVPTGIRVYREMHNLIGVLENLHSIESSSLAQVIGHDPKRESVALGKCAHFSNPSNIHWILAVNLTRCRKELNGVRIGIAGPVAGVFTRNCYKARSLGEDGKDLASRGFLGKFHGNGLAMRHKSWHTYACGRDGQISCAQDFACFFDNLAFLVGMTLCVNGSNKRKNVKSNGFWKIGRRRQLARTGISCKRGVYLSSLEAPLPRLAAAPANEDQGADGDGGDDAEEGRDADENEDEDEEDNYEGDDEEVRALQSFLSALCTAEARVCVTLSHSH
jgi:hypothetical protein